MRGNTNKNKECESGGSTNWDFCTNLHFGWSLISEVWFYSCKYKETIFSQQDFLFKLADIYIYIYINILTH